MNKFKIAETETFSKNFKNKSLKYLYKKIKNYVYPQLRQNPFYGINIKKLKGKYKDFYRYRLGNYRLFYKIEKYKLIVFIIDISHRKNSYD